MKTRWLLAFSFVASLARAQVQPLAVHEWGTFTVLQDERGQAIAGINTDDEPVPRFCHDLDSFLIGRPGEAPPALSKGVSSCHPDVTMRLETPVIYFHPPKGAPTPIEASVKVMFRGGWLTQFYPAAETGGFARSEKLTEDTRGSLVWNDLKIGAEAKGPETLDKVWTAPREVEAAPVRAGNGEGEKFLFYRGVGHLPCPLRVSRSADATRLEGRGQLSADLGNCSPMPVRHLWLASFVLDGTCAFRALEPVVLEAESQGKAAGRLFSTPAEFAPKDYSRSNLSGLRQEMAVALEEEGLFHDEAEALLNTWEASYFKSGGLRLFFTVPKAWTDYYLPLEISVPADIKRAMIGRIELVTPGQRKLLRDLAHAPVPTQPWAHYQQNADSFLLEGRMPAAYRDLGRFRNALLLAESQARPSPSLNAFILLNGLASRGR